MLYPLRKLVEADLTVAAINAQLAALNTLYGVTVPSVVTVADGAVTVVGAAAAAAFPMLLHYIGTQPTNGEAVAFGRRDSPTVPVVFAYHTRQADLGLARRDSEITMEALAPIVEGLTGKSFGSTLRQILNVEELAASVEVFESKDNAVVRLGGVLRATLYGRTQGL